MTIHEAINAVYAAYAVYSEAVDAANKYWSANPDTLQDDTDFGITELENIYLDSVERYNYVVLEHQLDSLVDLD